MSRIRRRAQALSREAYDTLFGQLVQAVAAGTVPETEIETWTPDREATGA
jgi:hypothetical protein